MKRSKKRIAVIGSGITGLTAAYKIKKQIEEENLPFELLVLESAIYSGGNIFTMKLDSHFFDLGVDSIDTREKEALELIIELGLEKELKYSQNGKEDVYLSNELHHLDFPTYKGLPGNFKDIWKYSCISFHGKLAFLRDAYLPPMAPEDWEIGKFLRHRIGHEMTEYIAEPFFSKIDVGDIEKVGIKNIKEPLYPNSLKYGSITKAIGNRPELMDGDGNYATFEKGLNVLTERLTEELGPVIEYNQKVTEIKASIEGTYILDVNHKQQVRVGAVIIATGPSSYKSLFADEQLKEWFSETKMTSIGYLLFSFPKGSIKRPPQGFGVLTPRRSDTYITSINLLNKKWSFLGTDEEFIGVSFGRTGENYLMSLSNKQLEEFILKELQQILHISEAPLYRVVKRWPESIPQYSKENIQTRKYISSYLDKMYPGIYIGGNGFDGYGMSQCMRQAEEMSKQAIQHVKEHNGI